MVKGKSKRAAYTLEFKREAVRLVEGGQGKAVTAKVLGVPAQTLDNWLQLNAKGKLAGADARPVSIEQIELARVKMERAILKKATGAQRRVRSDGNLCEVRLDRTAPAAMAGHTAKRSARRQRQRLL